MADAAAGLDLSSILGGLSSLGGMGLSAYAQSQQNSILQNALKTIGPTQLQGYNLTGPGGMSSSYNPNGGASIGLGSLNPAFGALVGGGTGGASAYSPALLQGLTSASAGTLSPSLANLSSAYGGNKLFQNLAATQAGSLGQTYDSVYGNTLKSLQAQQAPQVQQQAFGLQNTLFGNGTLNSGGATSGALAAGNFGSQVNAMNAQDALSAQQQALGAMSNQAGISSTLSNTGNSLLSNAFSNFGNTNQLISGLNSAQLNNSLSALQGAGALNTLGLNNYMAALQTGSAQANAKNLSLFPYAGVATSLAGSPTVAGMLGGGLSSAGSSLLGSGGLSGLFRSLLGGNSGTSSVLSSLLGGSGLASGGSLGTDAISSGSLANSALADAGFSSAGGQAAAGAAGAGASGGLAASGAFGTDAIASGALANSAVAGAGLGAGATTGAGATAAGSGAAAAGGAGAGGGAAALGALGAVAAPLAIAGLGMMQSTVGLGKQYWGGMANILNQGQSNPNYTAARIQLANEVGTMGTKVPFSQSQLAQWGITPQMVKELQSPILTPSPGGRGWLGASTRGTQSL